MTIPAIVTSDQLPLTPKTTLQEDLTVAGQRRVNIIWELTQALIAISFTIGMIYCSINKIDSPQINNACFLIVGFYFSRTNHAAIGGIGHKTQQAYEGR